jgi:hypothetical protein
MKCALVTGNYKLEKGIAFGGWHCPYIIVMKIPVYCKNFGPVRQNVCENWPNTGPFFNKQ